MKACKIIIEFTDGSSQYVTSEADIKKIGLSLPKNISWKKTASINSIRAKYYVMLKELCGYSGYTKTDLHEAIKPLVMSKFADFPNYFTTGEPEYSTKHLTHEGWIAMIEGLKDMANDIYGYAF
jgi:hypothetical protein